jgi:F-type H+-transporting ATPase subunit a
MTSRLNKLSTKAKVLLGLGTMIGLAIILGAAFGNEGRNNDYQPQNEFKLDPWIKIKLGGLDMSINKAVLYLFLAAALTIWVMVWIAKRMEDRPNRIQTAIEATYDLSRNNITFGNMDREYALKWFPFCATAFFFIWFSNLLGYLPLPTNSEETFNLFGLKIPSFAIYAATANISVPLVLALVVFISFTAVGIRQKGPVGYLKSLIPAGVKGAMAGFIFVLELVSNVMRLMSLSVRLFANILAGHLIILFMSGALAVLLGIAALGWIPLLFGIPIFLFEVGLVAGLQAFIFATLTAIYIGGAAAEGH